MKRLLGVALVMALLLCGCAVESVDITEAVEEPAKESTEITKAAEVPETENLDITETPAPLIDNDVVAVEFVEIFEVDFLENTCYLRLKVTNKSEQPITVRLTDAYVNDMSVMMMSGVPMDIEPGKKSQNPFIFSGFSCDEVDVIEFKVCVSDEIETDVVKIELDG